jgi:ornithine--oxo-acid transaminase
LSIKTEDFIRLEDDYGSRNYKPLDVVLTKGQGVWVWDVEGRRYLDFLSAYSAVNQGHCHPRIMAALREQAERLTIVSRAFRHDQLGLFYKELCELTDSHMILPMNSGVEAVESAIKAVRKWGYKVKGVPEGQAEVIACENNFHGRTISIVGFSTEPQYRDGYGPFTPGFKIVPFGDAGALKRAISTNTVAFLVEPIQSEAGVIVPPDGYLREVRAICNEQNVMLILDEIQTGLGRTGKFLAEEHSGIQSDLMLIGKALSGGFMLVSPVLSNKEVLGVFHPGDHGSTFGGNPLACAVARAALKAIKEEKMVENAAIMGQYFKDGLLAIDSPYVREIRGKGLMIGVEILPEAGGARRICERLKDKGLLCKETHLNVIRIMPPLIIGREEIDWALERIGEVLREPLD